MSVLRVFLGKQAQNRKIFLTLTPINSKTQNKQCNSDYRRIPQYLLNSLLNPVIPKTQSPQLSTNPIVYPLFLKYSYHTLTLQPNKRLVFKV